MSGLCTHSYNLTKWLSELGCEVHLVTCGPREERRTVNGVCIHSFKLANIPIGQEVLFSLNTAKEVHTIIKKEKIALVHGQSPASFGYALSRRKEIPYVVTVHSTPLGEISSFADLPLHKTNLFVIRQAVITQPFYSLLNLIEYQNASKIIVVSESIKQEVKSFFRINEDKLVTIPNGVDVPRPLIKVKNQTCTQTILFVGRMIWRKGVQYLLRAMPLVLQRYPKARLLLVGDGYYKKTLEEEVRKLHLENSVCFLGKVQESVIYRLYSEANVFVLPSVYEGLSIAMLEAMVMGQPIVVTKVGDAPRFIVDGQNGKLVEPGNYMQLAKAIVEIFDDTNLAEKIASGAKLTALTDFSWKEIARKTLKLYEEVLTRDGGTIKENSTCP